MVAQKTISVGDTVTFRYGVQWRRGVVIEDRGPIGIGKRHLYHIKMPNDPYEEQLVAFPEGEVELADSHIEPISSSEAVAYLKRSALLEILLSHLERGADQPRVWLTRDCRGDVVHTFSHERGVVGGATIPFNVLYDFNRILKPKRDEVLAFVKSFDLADEEAEEVVNAVGVAR